MGNTYRAEPYRRTSPDWNKRREKYMAGKRSFPTFWEAQAFIDMTEND